MRSHTPLSAFPLVDVPLPLNLHGRHTSQLKVQVLGCPAHGAAAIHKQQFES